jgi:hypothetical protein
MIQIYKKYYKGPTTTNTKWQNATIWKKKILLIEIWTFDYEYY